MRKFSPCYLLVVLLALPLAGQTDTWKKYEYANGNFSVLFPAEPQDKTLPENAGLQAHILVAQDKGVSFAVIYASLAQEHPVDDVSYGEFKAGVLSSLPNCKVGVEQQPSPALSGYIGHWYKLNCVASNNKITFEGNLYLGKRYGYAVMGVFPASAEEPSSVKKFTDSFALLEPGK